MTDQNPTADEVVVEDSESGRPIGENLKSKATWIRFLFMVICYMLAGIASFVGTFVIALGFLWLLFTGEVNRQIQQVGQSIAAYVYELVRYLTFNTEQRPFPLGGDWPSGKAE